MIKDYAVNSKGRTAVLNTNGGWPGDSLILCNFGYYYNSISATCDVNVYNEAVRWFSNGSDSTGRNINIAVDNKDFLVETWFMMNASNIYMDFLEFPGCLNTPYSM